MGDSDKLEVGDLVWALGSPYGLDRSLTFGIVSAKARRTGSNISRSPIRILADDAAVNPGNSGGPLVTSKAIIGINAAIFAQPIKALASRFPVRSPATATKNSRQGHVDRAWLGILPLEVPETIRTKFSLVS